MTAFTPTTPTNSQGASFLPWINQGLEGLWLLTVFLVPLMFLGQDYAISEALIANVEVPKVALLRTLTGLMALLWLFEWAITSRAFQGSFEPISINGLAGKLRPIRVVSGLTIWIKGHPTRWLILAAGLFFSSTFLSTVFSGSFTNSMWGEIPGQDGYSAYTIASYGVLFSVIATHLKSRAQLGRLLGAVVLMGFLVGLYAVLQHYHHDFFNLIERTGGGESRVSVFMGNPIFAAAVLSMTVPTTLMVAAINFRDETWGKWGPGARLGQLGRDALFTFLWASVLSAQILGLMFTFSRGPWLATTLALAVFLAIMVIPLGLRILIRTILVLGLSGVLAVAFLHWQGNVAVINVGSWLGFVIALLGLAGAFTVLYVIKKFDRSILFISTAGAIITIAVASAIAPSALPDLGSADATVPSAGIPSTTSQIGGRISSIKSEVLGGSFGGRSEHWKVSWTLIKNRPWFEFDDLSFPWLRQLIGYGPDLFRYTYLLESPPGPQIVSFFPLEPDHAHNFFIHQIVEQGILGGVASLSLFASAFWVAWHHLLFRKGSTDLMYRLLLFGLVAIIFGRFFEMSVGVARISDLTVLWVLFGLFAALVRFDDRPQEKPESVATLPAEPTPLRNRRRAPRATSAQSLSTALMFRFAIVALLVGVIGVVTWQKSINPVRASVAEGNGINYFLNNDLENSVEDLKKAIKLAPGVPTYYNNLAQVYVAYFIRPEAITEPDCARQSDKPYRVCLGLKSLNANLVAVDTQPFNFYARVSAANSAFNLQLKDLVKESYQAATMMVPNSPQLRNDLAEIQINLGFYDDALEELAWSLAITGESPASGPALYLKGKLLMEIERYEEAVQTLNHRLSFESLGSSLSLDLIRKIYTIQGVIHDIGYFDKLIKENPDDGVAFYFRGLANLRLGNQNNARSDMATASKLGLSPVDESAENRQSLITKTTTEARSAITDSLQIRPNDETYESALMISGQAYLDLQLWKAAIESFSELISLSTTNSASYRKRGDALVSLKRYQEAIRDYEQAATLNPIDSVNFVALGKVYAALRDFETAQFHFNKSIQLNPNSSDAYASRGFLAVQTGAYSMGLPDIDQAIELSPTNHDAYFKKAHAHIGLNQTLLALDNLDKAIILDPINADYFYSRGLLNNQLEDYNAAVADFTVSIELNTGYSHVDPRHAKPFVGRGIAYVQGGEKPIMERRGPELAFIDANKALELLEQRFNTPEWDYYKPTINLQLSDVHELLGDTYSALDQPKEAQNSYEQSLKYRE